jgi:hypothetical protein
MLLRPQMKFTCRIIQVQRHLEFFWVKIGVILCPRRIFQHQDPALIPESIDLQRLQANPPHIQRQTTRTRARRQPPPSSLLRRHLAQPRPQPQLRLRHLPCARRAMVLPQPRHLPRLHCKGQHRRICIGSAASWIFCKRWVWCVRWIFCDASSSTTCDPAAAWHTKAKDVHRWDY